MRCYGPPSIAQRSSFVPFLFRRHWPLRIPARSFQRRADFPQIKMHEFGNWKKKWVAVLKLNRKLYEIKRKEINGRVIDHKWGNPFNCPSTGVEATKESFHNITYKEPFNVDSNQSWNTLSLIQSMRVSH